MAARLEAATVISRGQRILFWTLLISSVLMAVVLLRMRERAMDRLLASAETMPLNPPAGRPVQSVTMMMANDMDGSVQPASQNIALPVDANARAHVILQHLITNYARPNSKHPIATNKGVNEIFFMTLPLEANQVVPGTVAVVDLSTSFVDAHPSGIEPETLTLLSIIGTLHANFPQISQVRFLVDGQQRDTLAGHADLTHIYLASDAPGVKHL
jgi:Sporulation and spore germination